MLSEAQKNIWATDEKNKKFLICFSGASARYELTVFLLFVHGSV
jgi:hypothetical protein